MTVLLEDLALIGNCQFSALVERSGSVVWCCLPRFDSEPVFSRLLDHEQGGQFLIGPADGGMGRQRYLDNTNVVETTFKTEDGTFRVIDFAPRFPLHERMFRPTQLVRIVEPLQGAPRVRIRCEPRLGWSKAAPAQSWGSHHVEFGGFAAPLRLTTDVPLSYLQGHPFTLVERRHMVLTWGAPIEEPLAAAGRPLPRRDDSLLAALGEALRHPAAVPAGGDPLGAGAQAALLRGHRRDRRRARPPRSPRRPASGRTWDYRYCWLRDAYYALAAFRLLGHFEERERFIQYPADIAGGAPDLSPVPALPRRRLRRPERADAAGWPGFNGERPVRVGNAAARHTQNDIFGEMVLALAPVFLDDRFRQEQTRPALELVERLARKAISVAGTPDAGIWEYRTEWKPQTFSSVMCWAAADRMGKIAERHLPSKAAEFASAAGKIREEILGRAFNPDLKSLVATYEGVDLDASLLQAVSLRLLGDGDIRRNGTIDAVWSTSAATAGCCATRSTTASGSPPSPSSSAPSGWSRPWPPPAASTRPVR